MVISVQPLSLSLDRHREGGATLQSNKSIDLKVRGLVLERISHAKGGLFPAASAPEMIIGLLPGFESGKIGRERRERRKTQFRKWPLCRRPPIGLMAVDPEGWLNALMQFILHIPGFVEAFFFAPHSWYPVQEFIDQYHQDSQENRAISLASGRVLFHFLRLKLSHPTLEEACQYFLRTLHCKWEIYSQLHQAVQMGGSDLFVTESVLKKQIFAGAGLCYDLDAFIEQRPDGANVNYIAYIKMEGSWFQCDDERITQLRSDSLALPLQRGGLAHYKQLVLSIVQ